MVINNSKERYKTLLYNAIGFMLENNMMNEELSRKEVCEEIADYLGSSVSELTSLGVLDYEDLTKEKISDDLDL